MYVSSGADALIRQAWLVSGCSFAEGRDNRTS